MIHFFIENIDFKIKKSALLKKWLKTVIQSENYKLKDLNFILCNDTYLHKINLEYLKHDTLTDIITFDNSNDEAYIEGDIYISIERIRENAIIFTTTFEQELQRVLVHGVLHLCGYKDKKSNDKAQMRVKENEYLLLFLA